MQMSLWVSLIPFVLTSIYDLRLRDKMFTIILPKWRNLSEFLTIGPAIEAPTIQRLWKQSSYKQTGTSRRTLPACVSAVGLRRVRVSGRYVRVHAQNVRWA